MLIRPFFLQVSFNGDVSNWILPSTLTDLSYVFQRAFAFEGTGVQFWNTQHIQSMYALFGQAYSFNADISGWDTHLVKDMVSRSVALLGPLVGDAESQC